MPVNIQMPAGQRATTLSVTNEGTSETAIQIRVFAWTQAVEKDELTPSEDLIASPPIATIAIGETQIVRLVLRRPPTHSESTYRILLDQIPRAEAPGLVQIVFRVSIPIFAQPATRATPLLQFHIEHDVGKVYLVGLNLGLRHEVVRDMALATTNGLKLNKVANASPYILAGATRRWTITTDGPALLPNEKLKFTAHAESGVIEQQVRVDGAP